MTQPSIVHRFNATLEQQANDRYPALRFELAGQDSLEVRLHVAADTAVIDLGVEGPVDGFGQRWRGWSGGARDSFVITRTDATPGYLPGLVDGSWAVVLGLHQLPAEGAEVTVEIFLPATRPVEAEPDRPRPPTDPRGSARNLDAPTGLTWFAGDFHAHTLHSDGSQSIAQLAAAATGRGLDFLAVTDHNTTSHFAHLPGVAAAYDLTLIPGQEVTTSRGHANALGQIDWVDFRAPAEEWLTAVRRDGGLLSLNHPLSDDCSWQHPMSDLPDLLEFFHISWFLDLTHTGPWAYLEQVEQRCRATGVARPVLIGGSDFHTPDQGYPPGTPTTWVLAEDRSPEAILAATAAGRVAISRFPGAGEPVLVRHDDGLLAVDADGTVLVDQQGNRRIVHGDRLVIPATEQVLRLESPDRQLLALA